MGLPDHSDGCQAAESLFFVTDSAFIVNSIKKIKEYCRTEKLFCFNRAGKIAYLCGRAFLADVR